MRYSIEPRDRVYVNGYEFMSFAGSMSNKYGKKLVDTAKKSATDAIKTASKRAIQKNAEATGVLVLQYQSSVSEKSTKKLPTIDEDAELPIHKRRYILPEKKTKSYC